jgi:serine phosphatase RsbU (regulator of sigma subunit)
VKNINNMLRKLFLLTIYLLPLFVFGQDMDSKVDSLVQQLDRVKGAERVDLLIKLSRECRVEEKALDYGNQAYSIAKSLKKPELEVEALNAIGKVHYQNYNELKSLEFFFQAQIIATRIGDTLLLGKTNRYIGQAYFYLDSFHIAKEYALKTIDFSRKIKDQSLEADALQDFGMIMETEGFLDSALLFTKQALTIYLDSKDLDQIARTYRRIGLLYFDLGEFHKSLDFFNKETLIWEESNNMLGLVYSFFNAARAHRTVGSYQLALEQYQKSLSISEKLADNRLIAANSSEIGLIYDNLSRSLLAVDDNEINYQRALSFHNVALKIYQEENNLPSAAQSLNNIANTYSRLAINQFVARYGEYWEDSLYQIPISSDVIMSTFGKAFEFYNQALVIFEEIEDTKEIINANINLGSHYIYARNWSQANSHLEKGLRMARRINSHYEIALALFHYGDFYFRQQNYEYSEQSLLQSLNISESLGVKDVLMHTQQRLAKVYEQTGNVIKALRHLKYYNLLKDEIFSEQNQKIITEMQTKYETEKKEQEIKLLNNERELQHSVIQRQKLTLAITIGGLVVFLAFAVLLINMVRQKQRANKILEEKNELISHQKQEITDSIRYASRIQTAILPSPTILADALKDHFVLFLPRDIVSGDFYWFTKRGNKMVLVAADCTGHGVPGAFMSMLGVSFLYEIVSKEGIMEPAKILDTLREFVKLTLSQTGKKDEQKDGMDISLSMLDMENMKLEWAGAYNPLILIRNDEIIEYKADKMPVAIHITDHKPFTNHEIDLQPNDVFYMFSDGFPDQFGGEDGRKYMSKKFKQFLLDIHHKPMEEQKELLHQEHLVWRGEMEQIDDVVIFGVRV